MKLKYLPSTLVLASGLSFAEGTAENMSQRGICIGQHQFSNGDLLINSMHPEKNLFLEGNYSVRDSCFSSIQIWPLNVNQRSYAISIENQNCLPYSISAPAIKANPATGININSNNPITVSLGTRDLEKIVTQATEKLSKRKEELKSNGCFN